VLASSGPVLRDLPFFFFMMPCPTSETTDADPFAVLVPRREEDTDTPSVAETPEAVAYGLPCTERDRRWLLVSWWSLSLLSSRSRVPSVSSGCEASLPVPAMALLRTDVRADLTEALAFAAAAADLLGRLELLLRLCLLVPPLAFFFFLVLVGATLVLLALLVAECREDGDGADTEDELVLMSSRPGAASPPKSARASSSRYSSITESISCLRCTDASLAYLRSAWALRARSIRCGVVAVLVAVAMLSVYVCVRIYVCGRLVPSMLLLLLLLLLLLAGLIMRFCVGVVCRVGWYQMDCTASVPVLLAAALLLISLER